MVTAYLLTSHKGAKNVEGHHIVLIAAAFVVAVLINYMLGLSKITGGSGMIP
jgi:hypothetical protein